MDFFKRKGKIVPGSNEIQWDDTLRPADTSLKGGHANREPQYPNGEPINEVTWANEAGFCKTKEQMELIEQQAFENGSKEALNDAVAGRYAATHEIFNKEQVKAMIQEAVAKHDEVTINTLKNLSGAFTMTDIITRLKGGDHA